MPEPMRPIAERTAEKERIEQSLISVREVLPYLETDRFMDLKGAAEYLPLSERTIRQHLNEIPTFAMARRSSSERVNSISGWRVFECEIKTWMRH